MAPQQQNTLVFIDEDQRHKYSKSTLSAINAQVAKHAHKQRRSITKSKSAPSSPPASGPSDDQITQLAKPQQEASRNRNRRTSDPTLAIVRRRSSDHQIPTHTGSISPRGRPRQSSVTDSTGPTQSSAQAAKEPEVQNEKPPEDLADLFQNLCRITKYPAYQAFPFFLDLEERRLAHYWFTEVLKDDFGMKLQLENTFQGPLTKYPLAFQVPLRWIIAKAAYILHTKTGNQSLTVVYRSQQKALDKLQELLRDTNTPTDEAVGSILQSIIHNPEFRKVHLRGLDAMIENRGGLETVIRSSQVTCAEHVLLQYTFAEFDITQLEELEALKIRFFSSLLSIQAHAQEYTRMLSQMANWAASVDLLDCSDDSPDSSLSRWSYTEQRQRIFSSSTATGNIIRTEYDITADLVRKSRLFAALFQIAAMFIEYDTTSQRALLLRRLEEAAKLIAADDPVTGAPQMMAGAHIYMMGHVSRQVQEELDLSEGQTDEKGIPVASNGIVAIKIFGLLLDSMRSRLYQYLQSWLLGEEGKYLSPSDISAMSAVITQLWLQKMRNSYVMPLETAIDGCEHIQPRPAADDNFDMEPYTDDYLEDQADVLDCLQVQQDVNEYFSIQAEGSECFLVQPGTEDHGQA